MAYIKELFDVINDMAVGKHIIEIQFCCCGVGEGGMFVEQEGFKSHTYRNNKTAKRDN